MSYPSTSRGQQSCGGVAVCRMMTRIAPPLHVEGGEGSVGWRGGNTLPPSRRTPAPGPGAERREVGSTPRRDVGSPYGTHTFFTSAPHLRDCSTVCAERRHGRPGREWNLGALVRML